MISDDGWISWTAGECPVTPDTLIQVEYGPAHPWPGDVSPFCKASTWGADYWIEPGEIARYRLWTGALEREYAEMQQAMVDASNGMAR